MQKYQFELTDRSSQNIAIYCAFWQDLTPF